MTLEHYEEAHRYLAMFREDPSLALTRQRRTAEYLDAVAYHEAGESEKAIPLLQDIMAAPAPNEYRDAAEALLEHLEYMLER